MAFLAPRGRVILLDVWDLGPRGRALRGHLGVGLVVALAEPAGAHVAGEAAALAVLGDPVGACVLL